MLTIDSMFELAIELRNKGELKKSINILNEILDNYQIDDKTYGIHAVLGGIHIDLGENNKALENYQKATKLNPESELSSLGLYLTLAKLNKDVEAIYELMRYLKCNPAYLYKDTLEELLEGLKEGYMTNYENEIRKLAKENGVES